MPFSVVIRRSQCVRRGAFCRSRETPQLGPRDLHVMSQQTLATRKAAQGDRPSGQLDQ